MPPTGDPVKAIEALMLPFSEHDENNSHPFWDYYLIGGRYSGRHVQSLLDTEKMELFYLELQNLKITVNNVVFGKYELSPSSQIEKVDALWNNFFPESKIDVCPIFKHYKGDTLDICTVGDVDLTKLTCFTLAIAKPENEQLDFLLHTSMWNGVTWIDTAFDGSVKKGIDLYNDNLKSYKEEYRREREINKNWIIATIDYHN